MGLLDWLLGRSSNQTQGAPRSTRGRGGMSADEQAIERYRYLLRTAPPETIEQAHAEAFAQLTPEQRQMMLQELSQDLPEAERAAAARSGADPAALARTATRAELRQPGTLERRFGGMGAPGMGMGGFMAGSFLSTIAGVVVGSAIANAFFFDSGYDGGDSGGDAGSDSGGDTGSDAGDGDFGGGDFGGGDFGDFGGGDFGRTDDIHKALLKIDRSEPCILVLSPSGTSVSEPWNYSVPAATIDCCLVELAQRKRPGRLPGPLPCSAGITAP